MKKSLIRSDVELQEGPFKGQDLNTYLYMNLPSVYLFRMSSNVMHEDGILEGDVVIVDRSLLIENGDYVVMSINGTFLLRQFLDGREPRLVCADDSIPDINLTHVDECELFGVVSSVIRKHVLKRTASMVLTAGRIHILSAVKPKSILKIQMTMAETLCRKLFFYRNH